MAKYSYYAVGDVANQELVELIRVGGENDKGDVMQSQVERFPEGHYAIFILTSNFLFKDKLKQKEVENG